jgi:cell division protein ZapA
VCRSIRDGVFAMSEMYAHVSVRILEKEYQVSCPADERTALLDSAEILNAKMREIRDSGKVVGLERVAVMAALNMANELLQANAKDKILEGTLGNRLKLMSDQVETVLGDTQQLDL